MLNKLQALRKKLQKKGKGFTLVELIVVIIIIAVIAAVAIPAITSFQDNARKSRIQSEHRQLVSAIQSYIGSQPDPNNPGTITLDSLAPYVSKKSTGGSGSISEALEAGAHEIKDNKQLISTFTPAGGGQATKWTYNWTAEGKSGAGATTTSPAATPGVGG